MGRPITCCIFPRLRKHCDAMSPFPQTLVPYELRPLGNAEKLCQQLTSAVQRVCTVRKQKTKSISFVLQDSWRLQMLLNVCVTQPNRFSNFKGELRQMSKEDCSSHLFGIYLFCSFTLLSCCSLNAFAVSAVIIKSNINAPCSGNKSPCKVKQCWVVLDEG